MKAYFVLPLLLLIAGPAAAQQQPADPAPGAKPDPRDPNAIRCRKISQIGSLVKRERVCKTNAEWARSSEQMQRDADDLITRSRAGMNPGN